ncbi:GNAT family N-acetyltransferase [Cyanobium sp. Morenito 9A2]|uniref:GNAT family N-acetyltransferase n=1 Tax=Cyanobium sp. Morenito 9A2 TaxID=2823718 RepID=UPI0029F01452|nr:GNAT family N-acetyltransferase [Cyanobium sp. Morenito 9A2]
MDRLHRLLSVHRGQPDGSETAAELLGLLAPEVSSGEKSLVVVEIGAELVGVVELVAGFPRPDQWYVGLLLLHPDQRGAGAGTAIWEHLRQRMIQEGASTVRLLVQKQNPRARRFWERQGFAVEKEMVARTGRQESPVWLLHRSLQAEQQASDTFMKIKLEPWNPAWLDAFERTKARLLAALPVPGLLIDPIGSTSLGDISAKPIIDILVGLQHATQLDEVIHPLLAAGFTYVEAFTGAMPYRRFFVTLKALSDQPLPRVIGPTDALAFGRVYDSIANIHVMKRGTFTGGVISPFVTTCGRIRRSGLSMKR